MVLAERRSLYTVRRMPVILKPLPVSPPPVVAWLGYGGVAPFVLLGIAAMVPGPSALPLCRALLAYGAVILSFIGALHWGFAMTLPGLDDTRRNGLFIWSVVPDLLGWIALLLIPLPATAILVLGYLAQYRMDRRLASEATLPPWYLQLRLRLTAAACWSMALGVVSA